MQCITGVCICELLYLSMFGICCCESVYSVCMYVFYISMSVCFNECMYIWINVYVYMDMSVDEYVCGCMCV